jgi:hypothetical protein
MGDPINLNYLYCMNINFHASIYQGMIGNVACDTKTRYALTKCCFCDHVMSSGSDLVLALVINAVNNQKATRISRMHN